MIYIYNTNNSIMNAEYSDLAAQEYASKIGAEVVYSALEAKILEEQGNTVIRKYF